MVPTTTLQNTMRIDALAESGLIEASDVVGFDNYVQLASFVAAAPVAFLSFIDGERQVIKSHVGLAERDVRDEHPAALSVCSRVIAADAPVVFGDARSDAVVADLWTFRSTGAVAFVGVPVHDDAGVTLGVLAVLDFVPREWPQPMVEALDRVATAITEYIRLREAEREVARVRRWRAAVFESITEGFFLVDRDWRFTYVNGHAAAMMQQERDALVGRDLWQAFAGIPGTACERALRRAVAEQVAVAFDFYVEPSDGAPTGSWLSIRAYPGPEGLTVFFLDISERHLADAELVQADRQKLGAMTRMAGAIAHHVNNLLTGVQGVADMLLAGDISPTLREDMEQIREATQRSAALTQKLLAYSGKQVAQPQVLNLNGVVRDNLDLHADLDRRGVRIALDLAADAVLVQADLVQVDQVLTILIDNAKEAMPRGGRLQISTRQIEVTPDMAEAAKLPPGPYAVLAVRDTGPGIAAELHKRVFEPFFSTKEPRSPTTGMGLAMARGLVLQGKGEIFLDSELERGTTFSVYLPRAATAAAVAVPPTPAAAPSVAQGVVLLAEDEPLLRKLAALMLTRAGFEVLVAADGVEALEIEARTPRIDLLVTDVVMPRMGGLQLAEQLRQRRADVPILFTSGYAEDVLTDSLRDARTRFLAKPYVAAALVREAAGLLAAVRAGQARSEAAEL